MVPPTTERCISQKVDLNELHHKLNVKFSKRIEKWKYYSKKICQ